MAQNAGNLVRACWNAYSLTSQSRWRMSATLAGGAGGLDPRPKQRRPGRIPGGVATVGRIQMSLSFCVLPGRLSTMGTLTLLAQVDWAGVTAATITAPLLMVAGVVVLRDWRGLGSAADFSLSPAARARNESRAVGGSPRLLVGSAIRNVVPFCHDEGVGRDGEPPTSAPDASEPECAFSETGEIVTTNATEPESKFSHPHLSPAVATYGNRDEGGGPVREPRRPRPPQGPATVSEGQTR
jgi:hypothetical protein